MDSLLCPVIVGRDAELSVLTEHLDAARQGRGRLAVLVGEAGVGKSRLVRRVAELAVARGMRTLSGRAVPSGSRLPFRPLTEALLVVGRDTPAPDAPEPAGFAAQLARIVPDWAVRAGERSAAAESSPVLVGEAPMRASRQPPAPSGMRCSPGSASTRRAGCSCCSCWPGPPWPPETSRPRRAS